MIGAFLYPTKSRYMGVSCNLAKRKQRQGYKVMKWQPFVFTSDSFITQIFKNKFHMCSLQSTIYPCNADKHRSFTHVIISLIVFWLEAICNYLHRRFGYLIPPRVCLHIQY